MVRLHDEMPSMNILLSQPSLDTLFVNEGAFFGLSTRLMLSVSGIISVVEATGHGDEKAFGR